MGDGQDESRPKSARCVFFSFHYQRDLSRAEIVRSFWRYHEGRCDAGFFEPAAFESAKASGAEGAKQFLIDALEGTNVTCVLIGNQTAFRPWVRYELVRSFFKGNGLFAIRVHGMKDMDDRLCIAGPNPFDGLAYHVADDIVFWQEYATEGWVSYRKVPPMSARHVAYNLAGKTHNTFSCLFEVYDWNSDNGPDNLAFWIEKAAIQAGK
jgi:hypothetical protein